MFLFGNRKRYWCGNYCFLSKTLDTLQAVGFVNLLLAKRRLSLESHHLLKDEFFRFLHKQQNTTYGHRNRRPYRCVLAFVIFKLVIQAKSLLLIFSILATQLMCYSKFSSIYIYGVLNYLMKVQEIESFIPKTINAFIIFTH